jgi:PRTRC genetic system ThiF family protein
MKAYWQYLRHLALYYYHHSLARLRQLIPPAALPSLTPLKLEKQYRFDLGHPDRIVILLVGCGGTGAFVAHILAQLAVWAKGAGLDLRLYFVDPDHVEEKNLVRQNFCSAEVGYPKAFSLAWRYTAAFGLTITPLVEPFSAELLDRVQPAYSPQGALTLVIGAVDNVCARRAIAEALTARLQESTGNRQAYGWLDAGNERFSGQVIFGNSLDPEPLLSPLGYCLGLPLPHLQEPSLLLERERPLRQAQDRPPVDLSCADLRLLEEQSAMINRAMATWLGLYLYRLLQSRDLTWTSSWLNLSSGVTRSVPITGGRVVAPARPRPGPVPAPLPPPAAPQAPEPETLPCPLCGGEIITGEDDWTGVRVGVRFCDSCNYREEVCPECGSEIAEAQSVIEADPRPAILCLACGWHALIPAAVPEAQIAPVDQN